MPSLENKKILVVSPQSWGKMFVSKHHYAIELARRGNQVYFLCPPNDTHPGKSGRISIIPSGVHENLKLVYHSIWFPYNIKFHALQLFHYLMKGQISKIMKAIGGPPDIVWSFDLGNLYPFRLFGAKPFRIFHPVDEPLNAAAIDSAEGSDVIFSVTKEILEKYEAEPAAKHFINHGVSDKFLQTTAAASHGTAIHVGIAGNLLRPDIDRPTLLQIVRENADTIFECWGSYNLSQSNIGGGEDDDTVNFIATLKNSVNVVLHGPVPSEELAASIHRMDAFLICYDVQKDQSKGTNYHKIMEFLCTGKVIVSNNVTTYKDHPDLIRMVKERDNNSQLPGLFKEVIANPGHYNSDTFQQQRKKFAMENTYRKQIERIEKIVHER